MTYKWRAAENALEGMPSVLVRDGKLLENNMKRDRLTRSELESEMRLNGISSLADVQWAILEPEGKISFIGRGRKQGDSPDDSSGAV